MRPGTRQDRRSAILGRRGSHCPTMSQAANRLPSQDRLGLPRGMLDQRPRTSTGNPKALRLRYQRT